MHIVLVHLEKMPALKYGGTERVVEALCQGYLELGHQVSLIALKGEGELPRDLNFIDLTAHFGDNAKSFSFLELIPKSADIVHFQLPMGQDEMNLKGVPYICTMHGNMTENDKLSSLPNNMVFVSSNHAKRHERRHFVYNGLIEDRYKLNPIELSKRDYFSFLGKVSLKRKGIKGAKFIASNLKTPLYVGGGRGLPFGNTKYLGEINDEQKSDFLGKSKALLFPILWEEPFGLVMIEAMFCGTAVFALERGSVSEVLGLKGAADLFLTAENENDLLEEIKKFSYSVPPEKYREYAIRHFSYKKMCLSYLLKYKLIISGKNLKDN